LTLERPMNGEIERIKNSYRRRDGDERAQLYDPLRPEIYLAVQEKERALIRWIRRHSLSPVKEKYVLEIGCGRGDNILQLMRLGFDPSRIVANELLPERASAARERLPAVIPIFVGDAAELDLPERTFDIVMQSTVFSSILDPAFRVKLAGRIWKLVKPGGGILWYDFTYNNPRNRDVRVMPLSLIRELFPEAKIASWRLTLAPSISRRVAPIRPMLYTMLRAMPFLRTHLLCWIEKPVH
jgi:SAM-dependent methyltransferase